MFLEEIANPQTIVENTDYGQKLYFDYQKIRRGQQVMSHPSPVVLYLGTWRMTDRFGEKKKFLCALNLAILPEDELAAVQRALPDILKSKNMKTRYRVGKMLLPDIFSKAYRTYNLKNISTRPIKGRLYALKSTPQDKEEAEKIARDEYPHRDWGDLDPETRSELIDKAIQARGADNIERQERLKKEIEPEKPESQAVQPTLAPQKMVPLSPGPGIEPAPKPEPKMKHPLVQSPIKNIKSGMVNPTRVQIGQEDDPNETEPEGQQLP